MSIDALVSHTTGSCNVDVAARVLVSVGAHRVWILKDKSVVPCCRFVVTSALIEYALANRRAHKNRVFCQRYSANTTSNLAGRWMSHAYTEG